MKYLETVTLDPHEVDTGGATPALDEAHVTELVAGLRGGVDFPPIRLNGQRVLKYGFHRLAAHKQLNAPIRAEVYQYESADEEEMDSLAENARRRKLTPEQEKACLTLMMAAARREVARRDIRQVPETTPGRPRDPDREAARAVAKKTGRSERDVLRKTAQPPLVPPSPKKRPLRSRILDLHADAAGMLTGISDLLAEVSPLAERANKEKGRKWDPRQPSITLVSAALERAARARAMLEEALHDAANEQNRLDANIRRAGKATEPGERLPGEAPRTGLGGRKLRIEDQNGNNMLPDEPAEDTKVED